jgi:4-hydroxy-3-methylbut-2-enyl diphosphate reductase
MVSLYGSFVFKASFPRDNRLGMETYIVTPHGFCEGVVRAIALAKKAKKEHPSSKIHVLGMLVHNEDVIDELSQEGMVFHDERNGNLKDQLLSIPDASVLVFAAHGHDPSLNELAKQKKMIVYDATCRYVEANATSIVNEIAHHHDVIYIGKKNHAESMGALAIEPKHTHLFDPSSPKEGDWASLANPEPAVISQTTMDLEDIEEAKKEISQLYPQANFLDERCLSTQKRQAALLEAPKDIDVYVILGSGNSNNTVKLSSLALKNYPHAQVIRALNLAELKTYSLQGKKKAALASGASTSPDTFAEVLAYLKGLK